MATPFVRIVVGGLLPNTYYRFGVAIVTDEHGEGPLMMSASKGHRTSA